MALKVSFKGKVFPVGDIPFTVPPRTFRWMRVDHDHRVHAFDQWVFGVNPIALCGAGRDTLDEDNEAEKCLECLHRAACIIMEY